MRALIKKFSPILGTLFLVSFLVLLSSLLLGKNAREESVSAVSVTIVVAWLVLIVLPVLWIKYVWKEPLWEYGWRLPEMNKKNWIILAVFSVLIIGVAVGLSLVGDFQQFYKLQNNSLSYFLFMGLATPFLYFVAEEFIFRGFLFFRLLKRIELHSYWVVGGLFALFHISKPPTEIIISFVLNMVFCAVAQKTKSFLPAVFLHFILAVTVNILVNYVWISSV